MLFDKQTMYHHHHPFFTHARIYALIMRVGEVFLIIIMNDGDAMVITDILFLGEDNNHYNTLLAFNQLTTFRMMP